MVGVSGGCISDIDDKGLKTYLSVVFSPRSRPHSTFSIVFSLRTSVSSMSEAVVSSDEIVIWEQERQSSEACE